MSRICFAKARLGQSDEKWREIFREARELGVSFILLAGGDRLHVRILFMNPADIQRFLGGDRILSMLENQIITILTQTKKGYIMLSDNDKITIQANIYNEKGAMLLLN